MYINTNKTVQILYKYKSTQLKSFLLLLKEVISFNPFTPTDHFSVIQNNEWNSLLKLLSVERVKMRQEYQSIILQHIIIPIFILSNMFIIDPSMNPILISGI